LSIYKTDEERNDPIVEVEIAALIGARLATDSVRDQLTSGK
jgi:hypothetical protein